MPDHLHAIIRLTEPCRPVRDNLAIEQVVSYLKMRVMKAIPPALSPGYPGHAVSGRQQSVSAGIDEEVDVAPLWIPRIRRR